MVGGAGAAVTGGTADPGAGAGAAPVLPPPTGAGEGAGALTMICGGELLEPPVGVPPAPALIPEPLAGVPAEEDGPAASPAGDPPASADTGGATPGGSDTTTWRWASRTTTTVAGGAVRDGPVDLSWQGSAAWGAVVAIIRKCAAKSKEETGQRG